MQYRIWKSRDLIEKFVLMSVNPVTVDMGESGEKSIRTLFDMAKQKNLVSDFELKISEQLWSMFVKFSKIDNRSIIRVAYIQN